MRLHQQIQQLTHAWVTKGNKSHRQRQRSQMLVFAAHAETLGARDKGQVGAATVISFWKRCRTGKGLSLATQTDYWRAIKELWELWGKLGEPPKPRQLGSPQNSEKIYRDFPSSQAEYGF